MTLRAQLLDVPDPLRAPEFKKQLELQPAACSGLFFAQQRFQNYLVARQGAQKTSVNRFSLSRAK